MYLAYSLFNKAEAIRQFSKIFFSFLLSTVLMMTRSPKLESAVEFMKMTINWLENY